MGSLCGALFGQSQSTSYTPPAAVTNAVTDILNRAATQSNQPYPQYTPDTAAQYQNYVPGLVAPMTPNQVGAGEAISGLQGYTDPNFAAATGLAAGAASPLQMQQFSQGAINQYMNPYLNDVVGSAVANINQTNAQQQQQVLGNAIQRGAFGGDRAGIAQAELARQQGLANNATIANLLGQGYGQAQQMFQQQQGVDLGTQLQNRQLMANAATNLANLGTQGQQAALQQAQAQYGYGTAEQQQQQAGLSTAYQQYLNEQAFPYQQLSYYSQLASGAAPALGGTTTGYSPTVSPAAGALGGLSTLGALSNPGLSSSNPLAYANAGLGTLGSIGSGIFTAFGLKDGGRVGYAEGGVPVSPVTQAYNNYINAISAHAPRQVLEQLYQNYQQSLQGATPPWKSTTTTTTPTTTTPTTTPTTTTPSDVVGKTGGGGGGGGNAGAGDISGPVSPIYNANGVISGRGSLAGPGDTGGPTDDYGYNPRAGDTPGFGTGGDNTVGGGGGYGINQQKGVLSGLLGGVDPVTGAQTGIAGAVNALFKGNSAGTLNSVLNATNNVAYGTRSDGTAYPNTTSGLTAQEFANQYTGGDLSKVSGSVVNGQIDWFRNDDPVAVAVHPGALPATQLSPTVAPVQQTDQTGTSVDTSKITDPLAGGADLSAAKAAPITTIDSGGYNGIPSQTVSLADLQRQQEVENSLPSGLLAATSQLESSNNPNASQGNSVGLYGFMPKTATGLGLVDPTDPAASTTAAGTGYGPIINSLQNAGIQNPSAGQAYLGWQQGATGANALLTAPDGTSAVQALINAGVDPDKAQASIANNVPKGTDPNISAKDFAKLWVDKANAIANAQPQVQPPSPDMAVPLPPTQGDTNYTATPIPVQTDLSYLPIQQPDTNASATGPGGIFDNNQPSQPASSGVLPSATGQGGMFDGNQAAPAVPNQPAVEQPSISGQNVALASATGQGGMFDNNQPSQPASSGVLPSATGQGGMFDSNPSPAPTLSETGPENAGSEVGGGESGGESGGGEGGGGGGEGRPDSGGGEGGGGGGGGDKRGGRIGPHHNHYAAGGFTPITMQYGLPTEDVLTQIAQDYAGTGVGTLTPQVEAMASKGVLPSAKGGRIHAATGVGLSADDQGPIAGDTSFYNWDDDDTDTSYLPIEKAAPEEPWYKKGFAVPQIVPSGLPASYEERTKDEKVPGIDIVKSQNMEGTVPPRTDSRGAMLQMTPEEIEKMDRPKGQPIVNPNEAYYSGRSPWTNKLEDPIIPKLPKGPNEAYSAPDDQKIVAAPNKEAAPAASSEPTKSGIDISKLDLSSDDQAAEPVAPKVNPKGQQVAQDMTRTQSDAPQPGFGYVAPPPADMRNFFGFNYGLGLLSGQNLAAAGDSFAKNVMAQQEQQRATMEAQARAAQAYGAAQSSQAQARYTDTQRAKAAFEGTIAGTKAFGVDANGNPIYTLMRPLRPGESMTANGQIMGGDGVVTNTGTQLQHINNMPMASGENADQKATDLNRYSASNMAGADPATVAAYNGEYRKQFDEAQQRASAAGYDKKNINETAVVLGDMPKNGLFAPGKGAGTVYNTASYISSIAQRFGIDLGINKDTPLPEILQKIRTLKAESYTGAQRTAAVWLNKLADANPSEELRPETSNAILTQYMLDNQRSIDFANHMEDVGAINPTAINGANSFNKMYGNTYRQEQQAISTLLNSTMPNGSNPIAAAIKGDLKQKDFDIIVRAMQKQGMLPPVTNLDRYIWGQ